MYHKILKNHLEMVDDGIVRLDEPIGFVEIYDGFQMDEGSRLTDFEGPLKLERSGLSRSDEQNQSLKEDEDKEDEEDEDGIQLLNDEEEVDGIRQAMRNTGL